MRDGSGSRGRQAAQERRSDDQQYKIEEVPAIGEVLQEAGRNDKALCRLFIFLLLSLRCSRAVMAIVVM